MLYLFKLVLVLVDLCVNISFTLIFFCKNILKFKILLKETPLNSIKGENILDLKDLLKKLPLPLPIRAFFDFLLSTKLGLTKIQYFFVENENVPFLKVFFMYFFKKR